MSPLRGLLFYAAALGALATLSQSQSLPSSASAVAAASSSGSSGPSSSSSLAANNPNSPAYASDSSSNNNFHINANGNGNEINGAHHHQPHNNVPQQQSQQSQQQQSQQQLHASNNATITHHTVLEARLNHLVVDRNTGRVFVGGINRLYQLSPDLETVATAVTGPQNDSTECTVLECPQNTRRRPTDNVNKVLLIDYSTSRLITCGSVFQVRMTDGMKCRAAAGQRNVVKNEYESTIAMDGKRCDSLRAIIAV